jgi:putative inorganic carbon (HCO3(-)) transporter
LNFAAFVLLNVIVFLRPAEVFEGLAGVPFYAIALLACLALNLPGLVRQLAPEAIAARPVSACIIAMLPAVALSQLWHGDVRAARDGTDEFGRVLLYYMLLVGAVTRAGRHRSLMGWVAILVGLTSALALFQHYGIVDLPALLACEEIDYDADTVDLMVVTRIQATGLFNNPNALARVLVVGMLASACRMTDPKRLAAAPFWLGLFGLLGYTLLMTKSRGGFLGLLAGLTTLLVARLGVKRAILPAVAATAAILLLVGGRQTDLSTDGGTGHQRIEIWEAGMERFRQSPAFGIGMNNHLDGSASWRTTPSSSATSSWDTWAGRSSSPPTAWRSRRSGGSGPIGIGSRRRSPGWRGSAPS